MKKKRFLATVLTATLAIGMFAGCGKNEDAVEVAAVKSEEPSATGKDATKEAEKALKVTVTINVKADKGWDKDSTPAIAHIVSRDKKTDFYHAVRPDNAGSTGTTTVKLAGGNYNVGFVSPLNKDGSAYDVQGTGKAKEIELEVKTDAKDGVKVDCPMTQVPADKVTDEMLRDIIDKTQDAVENGDESMKGDAGKDVLEKLGENVGNSPNASDKTKEEAGAIKGDANTDSKESEEAKKEDGKKDTANTGDSGNKQTANNNTPNNNVSNNTGNNASKPTGGNTQNNKPSKPAEQPKPAHQHSWKDHVATKSEWIPNIVTVDDYAEQQVQVGSVWQCNCGAQVSFGAQKEHAMNHILNGEDDGGRDVPIYETQTVKVGSHTEDRGSYQTTSYVDYQYCDCGAKR